jgi:hypothetical protein
MNPYDDPNTPGPDGTPPVAPRKRHHYIRWTLAGIGALILLIVVISVAAGGGGKPAVTTAAPATASSAPAATLPTDPNGQQCPNLAADGYCPGDSASPSPSAPLTGGIGTTFTITTTDDSGNAASYDVTLDKVDQSVYPGAYETPQTAGDHFAAAEFTIKGDTGSTSDDANSDASALGPDGTQYQFSASVNSLPEFNSGLFNVGPGQSVKGWVAFELPAGVTVASVQWAPSFNGSAATWTVGS